MRTNRREFIALGAGTGFAAAIGGIPRVARATDVCKPPYPPGTKTNPWVKPSDQKISNRLSAYTQPDANTALLRKAYEKMKGLPDDNPRSMEAQRLMHAWYCACAGPSAANIHQHWTFLPWHRGFLYFHERILGSLIDNYDLRLTYWDWENLQHLAMPTVYAQKTNNSLANATRFLQPGEKMPRKLGSNPPYDYGLVAPMVADDFDTFGGDAVGGGALENGPHGFSHVYVGGLSRFDHIPKSGDMAVLNTAARDPIFFSHHGNVDRMWYSWQKYPGHTDPGGAFQDLEFTFFDPVQKWVTIKTKDMLDPANLGYGYDSVVTPLSAAAFTTFDLALSPRAAIGPPNPEHRRAIDRAKTVNLDLKGLEIFGDGLFQVRVASASGSHVVGEIFVVPHRDDKERMPDTATHHANVRFTIPQAAAKQIEQGQASLALTNAASQSLLGSKNGLRVKVRSATLSVR